MQILSKSSSCPFCYYKSYLVRKENSFNIYRCEKCFLLFVSPLPEKKKDTEIVQYWGDDNLANSHSNINKYNKVNNFFLKILKKYKSKDNYFSKALDIGCGYGFFVKLLLENNFDSYGLDISKQSTYYASNHLGLEKIYTNDLSNEIFEDNFFDYIIALNLLEHVPDPANIINIIHNKIKKKGIFIIRVPNMSFHFNFRKIIQKIQKKKYSLIATTPPVHLYGYSFKNLGSLLENNKFKILETGPSKLGSSKKNNYLQNIFIDIVNFVFKLIFFITFNQINISPSMYIVCKKL